MTSRDRAELQVAAVIGAVLGGVTGYLISSMSGSGGLPKIFIWALIGAVVFSGIVYCLRGPSFVNARRFPPPWLVDELEACFVVKDGAGQKLAHVYFDEEPGGDRQPICSPKTGRGRATAQSAGVGLRLTCR